MDYFPKNMKKSANEKLTSVKSAVSDLYGIFVSKIPIIEFKLTQSAIRNVTRQFSAEGVIGYDALSYIKLVKNNAIKILSSNKGSKIQVILHAKMESTDIKDGEVITESISSFQRQKSNFRFVSVEKIDINIIEYKPLKGKSFIPLPKELSTKKAIINMKNEDNEYISVNVFGYENLSVYPLRISENKNRQHQIDLLLISNDETNHYCLIKNLSRLLSSQLSNHDGKKHFCRNCLQGFSTEESLANHNLYCDTHDSVRIEMPKPNTMIEFNHFKKTMRVPLVVYADFESIITPINTCTPNPNESYTKQYQKHTPSSFCYYIKCFNESVYQSKLVTFTASSENEDVAQKFIDMLEEDIKKIYNNYLKFPKNMILTSKNKEQFDNAKICHICEKDLKKDRVRDHCHINGKYRGAARSDCNLQFKIPKFIPILFHNLTGYDLHLFIKKLSGNEKSRGNINCIPNNEERYISFSKELKVNEFTKSYGSKGSNKEGKKVEVKLKLRFLDSFRFMAASLDSLTKNLSKDQYSIDKLNETQLPPKESFYSRLNNEEISDEDYLHAQNVWKEFNCETFRDYHNLYNVSGVLLLADVFENFRNVCIKNYRLDPAWYYTAPGLAWDAALLITKVKLELLSDYDMILMIKEGIRGGISMISNRLGIANNKYMENCTKTNKIYEYKSNINDNKWIDEIIDRGIQDANNLYGWAMSKPLPTHGFEWMDNEELENWKSISCILEVDLDYPEHLHDLLGMKLTKIHRGIKFEESAWLSKYINLNTDLRTKATNDFEKDFFKLMNNSVFGKTMENIENRVDVRLVTKREEAIKLASKPNYESRTIFDENLIAIHMKRTKLVYNKPIYLELNCYIQIQIH
ncbi:uncharacterized protein LOC136093691 [Hydra vulgaris]|uniref:uncharacterized protein LOC136093691 n=1 Tax=Hydra vulgaris TaxID=6087 RepID=UPI0032E9EF6E